MSAWGTGSFDNEDAAGWLAQLASLRLADLRELLVGTAANPGYLEAPQAAIAIAAAEVVAAIKGAPAEKLPREVTAWLANSQENLPVELPEVATSVVEKVRRNSELRDLWLEADGLNEWTAALQELQTRLSP